MFAPSIMRNARPTPHLQPILSITLECIWCGQRNVHPVTRTQKTCGKINCARKLNLYREQNMRALRNGKAVLWGLVA